MKTNARSGLWERQKIGGIFLISPLDVRDGLKYLNKIGEAQDGALRLKG
jgi:hypothetical protein